MASCLAMSSSPPASRRKFFFSVLVNVPRTLASKIISDTFHDFIPRVGEVFLPCVAANVALMILAEVAELLAARDEEGGAALVARPCVEGSVLFRGRSDAVIDRVVIPF